MGMGIGLGMGTGKGKKGTVERTTRNKRKERGDAQYKRKWRKILLGEEKTEESGNKEN